MIHSQPTSYAQWPGEKCHPFSGWLSLQGTLPGKEEERAPLGDWVTQGQLTGQIVH